MTVFDCCPRQRHHIAAAETSAKTAVGVFGPDLEHVSNRCDCTLPASRRRQQRVERYDFAADIEYEEPQCFKPDNFGRAPNAPRGEVHRFQCTCHIVLSTDCGQCELSRDVCARYRHSSRPALQLNGRVCNCKAMTHKRPPWMVSPTDRTRRCKLSSPSGASAYSHAATRTATLLHRRQTFHLTWFRCIVGCGARVANRFERNPHSPLHIRARAPTQLVS